MRAYLCWPLTHQSNNIHLDLLVNRTMYYVVWVIHIVGGMSLCDVDMAVSLFHHSCSPVGATRLIHLFEIQPELGETDQVQHCLHLLPINSYSLVQLCLPHLSLLVATTKNYNIHNFLNQSKLLLAYMSSGSQNQNCGKIGDKLSFMTIAIQDVRSCPDGQGNVVFEKTR